jgi:uncharacterized membrane protein YhhN
MKKSFADTIPLLFVALLTTDIVGIITPIPLFTYLSKPLLMPVLLYWLYAKRELAGKQNTILFVGLFFSFIGDTLLLFEDRHPFFFIGGLLFFLATHFCYIIFFSIIQSGAVSLLKKQPLLIVLVLLYGCFFIWLLYPHLGALQLPVVVYALFICTMLLACLHVYYKVSKPSRYYYVWGALLFVLSDSLLAINKFYQPFSAAAVFIIVSYCAAQYFMVKGFIGSAK